MSIDHDYAFAGNSQKKLGNDGRPIQMQMGDHQMMANQRTFVQKVVTNQPGGQNVGFMQGQQVRMIQQEVIGQQRLVQVPGGRVINTSGGVVRQFVPTGGQQQFQHQQPQHNNNYAHAGTIAGRSAAAAAQIRTVQHVYQQRPNGGPMIQQGNNGGGGGGRAVYVTNTNQQMMGQQVRYVQHPHQQQPQHNPPNPPQQQFHHQGPPQMGAQNQSIMQQRAAAQQHSQQMQRVQMGHPHGGPQVNHPPPPPSNQQQIHHGQQQQQPYYVPRGMNLAVPLREPSPEPVVIKQEIPEVPPESSVKVEEPIPDDMDIDIQIRNVVCNYTLPLHIDLRKLAMNTTNVTYEREKGVMMKQKRSPGCYIKVYSSGKVYIVGCRSEADCRKASRSIARHIQRVMGKVNERVVIRNYRVNNVLATCRLPFGIKIEDVAAKYPSESTYEPELSVGLVWRSTTPKATLRIHTTGSITVTGASSEEDVLEVISKIYGVVSEFRCMERAKGNQLAAKKRKRRAPTNRGPPVKRERQDDASFGNSGVINNQVYFSDEDEDLYDDLDLDD